ncbi:hypothetical protein MAR_021063 [Mya arenaria]|uniref:DDE-1 domain-containing protein n=1 Tax=Mya arenaria TaxID=6604 RepID=A0ABY7E972_MYAAR|nr:hypothetical protein MAR_021063 [Mya arenaria]
MYGQLLVDYDTCDMSEQCTQKLDRFRYSTAMRRAGLVVKQKVIGPTSAHTYRQQTLVHQHITAHLCVSASGRMLPPLFIFPCMLWVHDFLLFGVSESGFVNTDIFHQMLIKLFLPNCGSVRPVLLIMDNHDAHVNLHTINAADVVRFSKLATNIGHTARIVTFGKATFPIILHHAINQASPVSIKKAFSLRGLCPINIIDKSQLVEPFFQPRCNLDSGVEVSNLWSISGKSGGAGANTRIVRSHPRAH